MKQVKALPAQFIVVIHSGQTIQINIDSLVGWQADREFILKYLIQDKPIKLLQHWIDPGTNWNIMHTFAPY